MTRPEKLTQAQQDALTYVESVALRERPAADRALLEALEAAAVSMEAYRSAMARLRSEGRVAVAFHPDRLTKGGRSVAEGLLTDGVYRNQFETGVSAGSTSGFAGGRRDEWERTLFGGRYHRNGGSWAERPKYGALFLVDHPDGPCPRFGSCYFVLKPDVSSRCTFTVLGSQGDRAPEQSGTLETFEPVMLALAHHLEAVPAPLGCEGLDLARLVTRMSAALPITPEGESSTEMGRALDSFVEAQVHGRIDLRRDVEALVVDASFRHTKVAETLLDLASSYDITVRWHPGFVLAAGDFPEEFRGFKTRRVAEQVAVGGVVDAPSLGVAENDFRTDPEAWGELGSAPEVLTAFRRVWHWLVLAGAPSNKWSGS